MVKPFMKQPPNEERCWACLGRDIGQVVGGGVLYLTTPKWFCLRRDIGLVVDGEVFYLTASTWGGVLGLPGKGHWASSVWRSFILNSFQLGRGVGACLGRDIGLVVGRATICLTASKRGGVLDLSERGHWASSGRGSFTTRRGAGLVWEGTFGCGGFISDSLRMVRGAGLVWAGLISFEIF